MGTKRPFTEEDIQLSSFKHAKQFEFGKQQTSYTEAFSSDEVSHTADNRGEAADSFDNYQLLKGLGHVDLCSSSSLAEKELESSAPLSWVTSTSSEEDAGSGEPPFLFNVFPEFFEFNFPRRVVGHFEDDYSSLMSCSPRKQIPIGPNHQAEIPPWDPQAIESDPLSPSCIDDNEQRIGTCIISTSLSNYSAPEDVKIGQGRIDCDCLDGGSVRCVRQHVNEAREKLREIIGDKKFADLGFYEMGEEVAAKWTEEEERVFHKVVYSNPVSLGRSFWKQLPVVFPSRTSKDLVSYYFNVFMLRRRAVQNRSNLLEIDSDDDDEWKANDGGIFRVVGEDEDSVVDSFGDQDVNEGSEDDIPFENEVYAGDSDDDDGDCCNGDGEVGRNGDMGAGREDSKGKNDLRGQIVNPQIENLHNDFSSDNLPSMLNPTNTREHQNVQEESSTSSESQLCIGPSCVSFGVGRDARESTLKSDFNGCLGGESNGSSDGLESEFLLEPSGAKVWDESCSTVLTKGVDLLPTCNIIEEIFGPCTSKSN